MTNNNVRDFPPLHAELALAGGEGNARIVFVPAAVLRTKAATSQLVAAVEAKVAEYLRDEDLANAETWI